MVQWTEGRCNGTLPWDWRRTVLFTAFGAGYQGGAQYLIFNRVLVRLYKDRFMDAPCVRLGTAPCGRILSTENGITPITPDTVSTITQRCLAGFLVSSAILLSMISIMNKYRRSNQV